MFCVLNSNLYHIPHAVGPAYIKSYMMVKDAIKASIITDLINKYTCTNPIK